MTDPTTPEGRAALLAEGRALLRRFDMAPQMTESEVDAADAWHSWQIDNGEALLDALDEADHEIERQRSDLVIERRRAKAAEAALDNICALIAIRSES